MPATPDTAQFRVTVYLNADPDNFFGLQPRHEIATAPDLQLTISAPTPADAAEHAFAIGNRMAADDNGHRWPPDVRSLSVGDLVKVATERDTASFASPAEFYAVASAGFCAIPEPANPIVPLAGTTATSRT
jgi:hypothetical protein